MTRATRLVLAVSAAGAIAAGAYVQLLPSVRQPLVAEAPYGADIGRETSCATLRQWYAPHYNVWRGGVKDGHKTQVKPERLAMEAILERIGWLEERGRCGG